MLAAGRAATMTMLGMLCSILLAATASAIPATITRGQVDPISRFAVVFRQDNKQHVREELQKNNYSILAEGYGFYAVAGSSSLRVPSNDGLAAWLSSALNRRNLLEDDNSGDDHHHDHIKHLNSIAGVRSSEPDVRRYLHLRPTHSSWPGAAAPRRLAARRSAAAASQAAQDYATNIAASTANTLHLTGHWHHRSSMQPAPYDIWGNNVGDQLCADQDTHLTQTASGEVLPWGVQRIGANNITVQQAVHKGRVIVCIIDSGVWLGHPEYNSKTSARNHDQLDGCQITDNCPYTWSEDVVGHGTHVAGTIAAPQNGLGVIGVISQGAELHIVRIWNNSGDVSQGQGPYATDLVLAYDNCLSYLTKQQQQEKQAGSDKPVKMVINMSYGSAGPLTVERLWMEKAAKRGDMLFVGSAGNNGSWLGGGDITSWMSGMAGSVNSTDVKPAAQSEYESYPASYDLPEVLSVANAACDGTIDFTSQKNKQVSIAAPGMAILSSVPDQYGAIRAYVTTNPPLPASNQAPAPAAAASHRISGAQSLNGQGAEFRNSGTNGIRYRLGLQADGYREPRAIQGTRVGSTGLLTIVSCNISDNIKAAAYGEWPPAVQQQQQHSCSGVTDALCLVQLPGEIDWYHETCLAMLACLQGGGRGLVVWRDDSNLPGLLSANSEYSNAQQEDEYLLGTRVNCGTNCPCWTHVKEFVKCQDSGDCSAAIPPGIVVSAKHARAIAAASKTAKAPATAAAGPLRVNVTSYAYPYHHFDGTSMSAPHVSGAAALLWRIYPHCKAQDITEAIKASAEKLPKAGPLAAGHGLLRVDRAYNWLPRNKACAKL